MSGTLQYQNYPIDSLLPRSAVEKQLGISRATIYRLIAAGKLCPPVSLGLGGVRWKQSDISAYIAGLTTAA